MAYRVVLEWEGRRWDIDGVLADVRERASIWDREYVPRVLSMSLDLGDTAAMIAAGAHYSTARAIVYAGERVVSAQPVISMVGARAGELTPIEIGARVRSRRGGQQSNPIPTSRTLNVRFLDVAATQEKRASDRAAAEAEAMADRGWKYGLSTLEELEYVDPRLRDDYFPTVTGRRSEGRVYPVVIGRPGEDGGNPGSAAEAIPVDYTTPRLMIAGHPMTGSVTVRGPRYGSPQDMASESLPISVITDGTGRQVSVVSLASSTTLEGRWTTSFPEASERPWYWWVDDTDTASGLSGSPVDVVALLLAHVDGIVVDRADLESAREWLAPYTLSTVIDVVADAWDLLTGQVLPLLPAALTSTPAGVGLRPIRVDWTLADCRTALVEGEGVSVADRPRHVSIERDDAIANRVVVQFDPNKETGQLRRRAYATAARYADAARSVSQIGERERVVETRWVYRRSVAQLIARDLIQRSARDRLLVDLDVDAARYGLGADGELRAGDPVRLDLPSYSLSGRVAIVTEILRRGTRVDRVGLLLL